jgi:hypothetical protein
MLHCFWSLLHCNKRVSIKLGIMTCVNLFPQEVHEHEITRRNYCPAAKLRIT